MNLQEIGHTDDRGSFKIKLIFLLSVFFLIILLSVYSLKKGAIGFFIFSNIGLINKFIYSDNIIFEMSPYTPSYDLLLYLLHLLTGLPLVMVIVLPVGILITSFLYFTVSKKTLNDCIFAGILSIYIASESIQTGWYNTFAYSWSRPIYLCFILIVMLKSTPRVIIAAFLLFSGVQFIHYSVSVWIISLLMVIWLISRSNLINQNSLRINLKFILLFMISYLSFNKIFFDIFLPKFSRVLETNGYPDMLSNFLQKFLSQASGENIVTNKYLYYPTDNIYGFERLILNFIILIPLLITFYIITKGMVINAFNPKKRRMDLLVALYFALFFTIIVQAIIYGTVTGISNQFLLFMGPINVLIGLRIIKNINAAWLFLICLILIVAITLPSSIFKEDKILHYSSSEPSSYWLLEHYDNDHKKILSTISYPYYISFIGTSANKSIIPFFFTSEVYDDLISPIKRNLSIKWDYVIIDKISYNYYVSGETLTYYEPFIHYSKNFSGNSNIYQIYDDNIVTVYKT